MDVKAFAPLQRLLPGLLLTAPAVALALAASSVGLSPLLAAILIGAVVGNLLALPPSTAAGLAFASKRLLRVGVVALGAQITVSEIGGLGLGMIAVIVAVVAIGILATVWLGRVFKVAPRQRLLIACGFSICGAAAVAAADGVIEADEDEVATAVGLVVAFGTAMIGVVPVAAGWLGMPATVTGLWAGASIHEVAQVVAVGGTLGAAALHSAVVVKLARVLLLAPVLAILSVRARHQGVRSGTRPPIMPLFVAGFLAMVTVRSLVEVPAPAITVASVVQTVALTAAMFALGVGVRISALRKLGPRPVLLGACSTLVVSLVALGGTLLVS